MHHLRVFEPAAGVYAFYDGRIEGYRFAAGPNWVDDGALSLGIASYVVVGDGEAVVYDTHVSVEHARYIRTTLEHRGVRRLTVVLSHWHLDHIAGNAAFEDCEICRSEPELRELSLRELVADSLEAGSIHYYEPYEEVHRHNIETVLS